MPQARPSDESVTPKPIETDALIIGAGPVGLFQVFQLGLQEIHAEVVDVLPEVGGQCAVLYPDKPIYDIPGLPRCSGRELTQRLVEQIQPFQAGFHLGQQVTACQVEADGRFTLRTSAGTVFLARTVFIAAGVGAFLPKPLNLSGIERFEGRQLHHTLPAAFDATGQTVVIVGQGEEALDLAFQLADSPTPPQRILLQHRRDDFKADVARLKRLAELRASGRIELALGLLKGFEARETGELCRLIISPPEGDDVLWPCDHLFNGQGLSPRLGPIGEWGLAMARKQLEVQTESFETSVPGIYAVGDVNTYPGKRKLILCGFHEATLAAFGAAARLRPDQPVLLQYTTASPRLHALLGVQGG
jgi:thioredoxin reductase (NADPH)